MVTFSLLYTYINYVIHGSTNKMVSADLRTNRYTDDALQGVLDYKKFTRIRSSRIIFHKSNERTIGYKLFRREQRLSNNCHPQESFMTTVAKNMLVGEVVVNTLLEASLGLTLFVHCVLCKTNMFLVEQI